MTQGIQCSRCGWQNDSSAIMCGGCGQPLRASGAALDYGPSVDVAAPAGSLPAAPVSPDFDMPTMQDVALTQPIAQTASPPSRISQGKPAVWPGASSGPAARPATRQRWWRGPLAALIVLGMLAALIVGVWALVIRPVAHAQADGAIAGMLDVAVGSLPPIPEEALALAGPEVTVTDVEINNLVLQHLPTNSNVDSLAIAFRPGMIVANYSAFGQSGTIETRLQARNGELVATDTRVTGILGWVESGDELQATLNQELAKLRSKTPHGVQSVRITNGRITIVLRTS
jgi:hypothetical protein